MVDSIEEGKINYFSFRKMFSYPTVPGYYTDLSMADGNPVSNNYVGTPLSSNIFNSSVGIYNGPACYPSNKYLYKMTTMGVNALIAPVELLLCDYLLFYPGISMDTLTVQNLATNVTLPRYTDGKGVRMFVVATNTKYTGNATFEINYTDADGKSGISTGILKSNAALEAATLIHISDSNSIPGPFIPCATPGNGIRSIESIQFFQPNGGYCSIVLCKPIIETSVRNVAAPVEVEFYKDRAHIQTIKDGAVLNFICTSILSLQGSQIIGDITTIWD